MLAKVIYYMILGENVLSSQLDDSDKDLTKLFPDVKGIGLAYDLLRNCITGKEKGCKVEDAGALLKRIDSLVEQITSYPDKAVEILRWEHQVVTVIMRGQPLGDGCQIEKCKPFWVKFRDFGAGRNYCESLDDVKLALDVTRSDRLKLIVT